MSAVSLQTERGMGNPVNVGGVDKPGISWMRTCIDPLLTIIYLSNQT